MVIAQKFDPKVTCMDPLGPKTNPVMYCARAKAHKGLHTDLLETHSWAGNQVIEPAAEDAYGASGDMPEHCLRMRAASGRIDSRRKLVSFLYILARDHMTVGAIESLWINHVEPDRGKSMFTNGWLAQWADDLADRLEGETDDD